ncbi:MAG: c-type cytochrome domain-containing protein [Verrucomicrobiales bacterium]
MEKTKRIKPCLLTLSTLFGFAAGTAAGTAAIDYHADIAPLLRDYCAGCHNEFDYEADFSVETFGALMEGGESENETIVVPGMPSESFLLKTIRHETDPAMPPEKEPQLGEEEIALIARWIEEGAEGPAPEDDASILSTLNVPDIPASGNADKPVTAAEFSRDGKHLALARFSEVELQDAKTRKTLRRFAGEDGKVNAVHFSPDGRQLVAASGIAGLKGAATIWNVETGEKVRRLGDETHRDILFDAEFSPDGKLLATAGYDRVIRLWEVESGKHLRKFPSHNGAVFDLAFSPDGSVLASASGDSTGKIWQVASGERLDTLNQPQAEQFRIDFTPDGKFIVGVGADHRIRLWRFLSKTKPGINPVVESRFGHEDAIVDMALSRDGKWLVTTSADRALKRWSLPGLEQIEAYEAQPDVVSALAFSPVDGALEAGRMNGSTERYETADPATVAGKDSRDEPGGKHEPAEGSGEAGADEPAGEVATIAEKEDGPLQTLTMPSVVEGVVDEPGDVDEFRFSAEAGEEWVFEVDAARSDSALDSKIAVLTAEGEPVERVVLQAVRDSWLTFRGKDSTTSGDFRIHNWREMELNEFLYVNGEVVKLWHYPRGPDSGFLVYPGFGSRHTFFETTALAHPVGQPCYIVRALPPGSEPNPNGLPVYRLYYQNDDESRRELGTDSKLAFVAPEAGDYLVRIGDVRGFGGPGFHYKLAARRSMPDFSVSVGGKNPKISPGSGKELEFGVKRVDGFDGPVELVVEGLPETLSITSPLTIEAGQDRAFGVLNATAAFEGLAEEEAKRIEVVAKAEVRGEAVEKSLGDLGKIERGDDAKVLVEIHPDGENGRPAKDGVLEFAIRPGETITARVVAHRLGLESRIDFGKEDAGRNLPHGVYVDDIGLNGLMIPEGKSEQRFSLTAADWVPETVRVVHLRTTADGQQGSRPVRLRVVAEKNVAEN